MIIIILARHASMMMIMIMMIDGQVTACIECYCACHHRQSGSDTARRTSLAWRSWPDIFKLAVTVHHCLNRAPPYLSRSAASRFQALIVILGGICVPSTVIYFLYRGSGSALTAVGLFHSLASRPGTRDPTISVDCFGRICLLDTSASSALGVLVDNCAI